MACRQAIIYTNAGVLPIKVNREYVFDNTI